jgi:hypothetical protein
LKFTRRRIIVAPTQSKLVAQAAPHVGAVERVGQPWGVGRVTSRGERPAPHRVMRPTTSAQRFQLHPASCGGLRCAGVSGIRLVDVATLLRVHQQSCHLSVIHRATRK